MARTHDRAVGSTLTPLGGAICCDATLVSPLRRDGTPHARAPSRDGAALQVAERRKRAIYPELAQGGAQSLCVLGREIGGHWNASAMSLVRRLVALRSCRAPPAARGPAHAAWARRWWSVLSTAVQQATGHTALGRAGVGRRRVGCQPGTRCWHWRLPTRQPASAALTCADRLALTRDRTVGADCGRTTAGRKSPENKKLQWHDGCLAPIGRPTSCAKSGSRRAIARNAHQARKKRQTHAWWRCTSRGRRAAVPIVRVLERVLATARRQQQAAVLRCVFQQESAERVLRTRRCATGGHTRATWESWSAGLQVRLNELPGPGCQEFAKGNNTTLC